MKQHHILAAAALSLAAILPASAQACSVIADYRVPTNLELVGQSQLILRGRVVGEIKGGHRWETGLLVEPVEALKGEMPSGTIEISGSGMVPLPDEHGFGVLSNPYELEGAHPLSYIGACIRYMFPEGTTALFFLERRDGEWAPAGDAFSRWAEDVIRDDAPWMELTRFYARVLESDPAERKALLEAERDRLRARKHDPVAALMASDIERQLAGPNEEWNTIMRRAIEGEGEIPPGAESEAAAAAVADLIMETEQAEAMEEEALLACELSADGQSVDCGGLHYRRSDTVEDAQ